MVCDPNDSITSSTLEEKKKKNSKVVLEKKKEEAEDEDISLADRMRRKGYRSLPKKSDVEEDTSPRSAIGKRKVGKQRETISGKRYHKKKKKKYDAQLGDIFLYFQSSAESSKKEGTSFTRHH